jgi:hypothetical protein
LVAGVYAIRWGKLSRTFALLSESVTLSLDAGLHRSKDAYDISDAIEEEVRKHRFGAFICGIDRPVPILVGHHSCGYATVMSLSQRLWMTNSSPVTPWDPSPQTYRVVWEHLYSSTVSRGPRVRVGRPPSQGLRPYISVPEARDVYPCRFPTTQGPT